MKHAAFLIFALLASGCGHQGTPEVGSLVEARLVPHLSNGQYCVYQMPDGSLIEYDKARIIDGYCSGTRIERVEE